MFGTEQELPLLSRWLGPHLVPGFRRDATKPICYRQPRSNSEYDGSYELG